MFLKISQNSQKNTCVEICFLIKFIEKETPTQVLNFCDIFKNNYFVEHLPTAASERSVDMFILFNEFLEVFFVSSNIC